MSTTYKFYSCLAVVLVLTIYYGTDREKVTKYAKEAKFGTTYKRFSRQVPNTDCLLPPHPSSGWWSVLYNSEKYQRKMMVPKGTALELHCKTSYKLDGCGIVVCLDGKWTPEIGTCLKTCPSLHSQSILKVTCTYKNTEMENCTEAFDGTQAQFTCGYFYRDIRRNRRKIYCADGQWSENITECVPVCGQGTINPTLIINGGRVKRGDFPWQVAVYRKANSGWRDLICGGSLLSERVVLTAAHCVSNDDGVVFNKDLYSVAAGKYYRKYDDKRDSRDAQFADIHEIITHYYYQGYHQNYLGDIAILVTNVTFIFSARVQPVCVDWEEAYRNRIQRQKKIFAHVSGWGYTQEDRKPSDVLKNLTIPIVPSDRCRSELPDTFQDYLTYDKICAGYLDKGTNVCQGDSGGGLVVKIGIKYYIVGVVSLGPTLETRPGCDSNRYSLYTEVYHYTEKFILPRVISTRPRVQFDVSDDCDKNPDKCVTSAPFPPQPVIPTGDCDPPKGNINWAFINSDGELSNSPKNSEIRLKIGCPKGYKLQGNDVINCVNGTWTPEVGTCLKTCPSISSTSVMTVTCSYNKQKQENCSEPVDGTIVKYKCVDFYESKIIENLPIYCLNGEWTGSLPECVPTCGRKVKSSAMQGQYPWHIAIYDVRHGTFICSGTLLSESVVITAAHCFTNFEGNLLPTQNLTVAAGKFYQKYGDDRDFPLTQFASIEEVHIPNEYKGYLKNFLGDVALIVTKTPFKLSARVQPVCVDWDKKHESTVLNPRDNTNRFFLNGWGYYLQGANPVEQVSTSRVSLFAKDECNVDILGDFDVYMTDDKLCSKGLEDRACKTYAGGGLVLKGDDRFYLAGILSVSSQGKPEEFPCGQYHFFTHIYNYIDNFLLKKLK